MHKPTTLCNLIRICPGKGLSERGTCVCVFTGFWLRSITQRDRPRERTRLRQDMTRQLGDNTHTQTLIPLSKLVSHWFALEHPVEDASVSVSPTTQTHTHKSIKVTSKHFLWKSETKYCCFVCCCCC